mmetsp:Transcript_16993/g.28351  ORF Transcript_16993/g.28351 Transcript_16993/m.28351 type:complete len:211 (-) Transcript_16993:478-1110(-)
MYHLSRETTAKTPPRPHATSFSTILSIAAKALFIQERSSDAGDVLEARRSEVNASKPPRDDNQNVLCASVLDGCCELCAARTLAVVIVVVHVHVTLINEAIREHVVRRPRYTFVAQQLREGPVDLLHARDGRYVRLKLLRRPTLWRVERRAARNLHLPSVVKCVAAEVPHTLAILMRRRLEREAGITTDTSILAVQRVLVLRHNSIFSLH